MLQDGIYRKIYNLQADVEQDADVPISSNGNGHKRERVLN